MSALPTFDDFVALARDATLVPVARELVADGVTPVAALHALGGGDGSYLLESAPGGEEWSRYSFVGFDPDVLVRARDGSLERVTRDGTLTVEPCDDPWPRLRAMLDERVPRLSWLPRFWGGAVGYVAYDAVRRFEPKAFATTHGRARDDGALPELSFAVGGTLLVFDALRQTVRVVVPVRVVGVELRAAYDAALARIDAVAAKLASPAPLPALALPDPRARVDLPPSSFTRDAFLRAVHVAQEHIRVGDAFQIVLSQRFRAATAGRDALDVYRLLRLVNPSPYMYFLRFPEVRIAGASPETLVRLTDGVAEVRPIAGTRRRGNDDAEDARLAAELLADPKERAEHVMLVDLARNDLGRIGAIGSVRVDRRMEIERYSHVMHIVSHVSARLADGRHALDVLRATFPAGTLSGAPKVRAMQIIDELEPVRRGIYGGAVGYVGWDGNMDLAIAIRTVTERDGAFTVQAGAGIVEASDPGAEWEETVSKARAALTAIAAAPSRAR